MPAIVKYPSSWAQLGQLALRARLEGLDFETFWERAVRPGQPPLIWRDPPAKREGRGAVIWPNDTRTREDDREAIAETKDGWHRAYVGHPPLRRERALPYLLSLFETVEALDAGPAVGDELVSAA